MRMEESYYFIHINGQQRGPLTVDELRAEGITSDTMVWRAGLPNWIAASELPELAVIFQQPPFSDQQPYGHAPNYGQTPNYGPQQHYGNPKYPYGGQPPYGEQSPFSPGQPPYGQPYNPYGNPNPYQNSFYGYPAGWTNWMPWAIAATILAVVICGLLNTIFGVIGIVKANSANDAVRRGDPMAPQLNSSAKTWTIVSLVLSGIALIIGILFFSLGFMESL